MSLNFQAVLPDDSKNETKSMVQVTDEISEVHPELESKEQNEIQIFKNTEFGEIRTIMMEGEPYFVGKDVAVILGYSNASKAVSTHVDDDDKNFIMIDIADSQNGNVPIGQSKTAVINESGLYSLILSSKLPTAKKFKRWVTSEVLPSIRKYGAYATETTIDKIINDPDFGIRLSAWLKREKRAAVPPSNKRFITVNHKLM